MMTHYLFNRFRGFLGMIERDNRDVVVDNMCLNNPMKQRPSDKPKITIDGCCSSCSEVPSF